MTIGFVPPNWTGASDGSKKVLVAEPSSQTHEMVYELGDARWKNLTFKTKLPEAKSAKQMERIYNQISDDCIKLSGGDHSIPIVTIENVFQICQDEAEYTDSLIETLESGKDFFINNRKKYNGCFYIHYCAYDDDDEVESELLFLIK